MPNNCAGGAATGEDVDGPTDGADQSTGAEDADIADAGRDDDTMFGLGGDRPQR